MSDHVYSLVCIKHTWAPSPLRESSIVMLWSESNRSFLSILVALSCVLFSNLSFTYIHCITVFMK